MLEPRQRPDGKCALQGCSKKLTSLAIVAGDPFHSTECCRRYHGITFHSDEISPRTRRAMVQR